MTSIETMTTNSEGKITYESWLQTKQQNVPAKIVKRSSLIDLFKSALSTDGFDKLQQRLAMNEAARDGKIVYDKMSSDDSQSEN